MEHHSSWISSAIIGLGFALPTDLSLVQPTLTESNILCKLFFKSVNPFIRVLHEPQFGKELNQYRRGTFAFPQEFEALLFSIYTLTVNSLRPDIIEQTFSTPKNTLLTRLKYATQVALSKVDFFKTDKILTIKALLHYLVRIFSTVL